MEKLSKIPEDLEGKKEKLPTIIEEPDIHPELACLCAVVKEGIVQREKPVTLKPKRSPRIPAFSKGFVPAAVPEKRPVYCWIRRSRNGFHSIVFLENKTMDWFMCPY